MVDIFPNDLWNMFFSSGTAGYEDVNECLIDPCPEGYECLNIEGGYICRNPVTGEATIHQVFYDLEKHSCRYTGNVDVNGYVTLWGKRIYVGAGTSGDWECVYEDAQIDCKLGGEYLCNPVTCKDFWMDMAN